MSQNDIKRLQYIACSSYSTNGPFTIDEWFHAREWFKANTQYKIKIGK